MAGNSSRHSSFARNSTRDFLSREIRVKTVLPQRNSTRNCSHAEKFDSKLFLRGKFDSKFHRHKKFELVPPPSLEIRSETPWWEIRLQIPRHRKFELTPPPSREIRLERGSKGGSIARRVRFSVRACSTRSNQVGIPSTGAGRANAAIADARTDAGCWGHSLEEVSSVTFGDRDCSVTHGKAV